MLIDANSAAAMIVEEFGFRTTPDELSRLARLGQGPCYRTLDGKKRLYRPEDVRRWAAGRLGPPIATRDQPLLTHHSRGLQ